MKPHSSNVGLHWYSNSNLRGISPGLHKLIKLAEPPSLAVVKKNQAAIILVNIYICFEYSICFALSSPLLKRLRKCTLRFRKYHFTVFPSVTIIIPLYLSSPLSLPHPLLFIFLRLLQYFYHNPLLWLFTPPCLLPVLCFSSLYPTAVHFFS